MARHRITVADRANLSPIDPAIWSKVAKEMGLSRQQERLVGLLLRGKRDKEIAEAMQLSVATVRTYIGRIFARVGVEDRVELILRAVSIARALTPSLDRRSSR